MLVICFQYLLFLINRIEIQVVVNEVKDYIECCLNESYFNPLISSKCRQLMYCELCMCTASRQWS